MKPFSLGNCYLITFFAFLSIFLNKAIASAPILSSDLIKRGLDNCHNQISFCTVEKQSLYSRTCCSQCSCWSSCYEKGECCPDIANVTFKFKHSCQSVYYKNPEYWRRQTELPVRSYEMVTSCQDGTVCSDDLTNSGGGVELDDIVAVFTEPDLVIFKNKRCAECNGINDYKRWRLIASDCMFRENIRANMSGSEMVQHMLTNCIIFSFPYEGKDAKIFSQQTCERDYKDTMISKCNITHRWDIYDEDVTTACLHNTFFAPVVSFYTKERFKNVYCFMCNNAEQDRISKSCYISVNDRFTTEFVEMMDLQTDFSPQTSAVTHNEICKDNEVYDELFDMCRAVVCPRLDYFSDGICKNPPFAMYSEINYIFNIMLFPYESIPSSMPLDDIDLENLLHNILDVTKTRDICKKMELYSAIAYFHTQSLAVHYFIVEVNIFANFDVNCTLNRLANSLESLANGIELNITVPIGQERNETILVVLAPDNRTQLQDSRQKLALNNKTHFGKILLESVKRSVATIVIEIPFVCPHVILNKDEYSILVSEFPNDDEYTIDRHNVVVKTFVSSYDDYLDDQISRSFFICIDKYTFMAVKGKVESITVMGALSLALSCVSMTCTFVIFLLFCITNRLTNGPMVLFACALVNLFIAQGVFQFGSGWNDKPVLCQAIGIGVHYFWLASVFAFNAYCGLILRQLVSVKTKMCNSDLIISLFYVYGLPACFVLVNIVYTNADTSTPTGSGYGAGQCHINTALMRGLLFALPILLTVAFNIVINCMIAIKIKRTQSIANNTRRESQFAIVFFRLLIVAGITWVFGILKEVITSQVLDYCFVIFVAGQGIFLLFSFVCRQYFFQELRKEFHSRKSDRFLSATTTNVSEIYKQCMQDTT